MFSSRTGEPQWRRTGDDSQRLGSHMARVGDLDRDGFPELVLTRAWSYTAPSAALVLAARDGHTMWEIFYPKTYGSIQGGLATGFDLDADGRAEIAAGNWEYGASAPDGAVALLRLDP